MKRILALLLCAGVLCSCNNSAQTTTTETSSYIENPFGTTTATEAVTGPEEDKTPTKADENWALARVGLDGLSLTMEGVEGREFDYEGGPIEFTYYENFVNRADEPPKLMTLGVFVTVNGVYQTFSVNGGGPTEFHVEEFHYDTEKGGPWNCGETTMKISFEPVIAEADKDEKTLKIYVGVILNPHYEADETFRSYGHAHRYTSVGGFTCNVKTPITNYSDETVSTDYEEELIDDSVKEKYESFYGEDHEYAFTNIRSTKNYINQGRIRLSEDGKAEVGALFYTDFSTRYRVYYLVNGKPATFSGGKSYIEIDAEVGYIYKILPQEIENVSVYDSISMVAFVCPDENGEARFATSDDAKSVEPAE